MAQIERLSGDPADMLLPDPGPVCEAESMCHVKSVQELEHIKQPRRHCNTGCVKSKRNNGSMRWQASVV